MTVLSALLKESYSIADILEIRSFLHAKNTFNFNPLLNGLFTASSSEDAGKTGYNKVWVRDNIYIAYAHYVIGEREVALRNVQGLLAFYGKHRFRFETIIDQGKRPSSPMERPHVRFDGLGMKELDESWEHAQNDALSYLLWLACKLYSSAGENQEEPTLDAETLDLLILFPLYFDAIQYWKDEDSGHWEEAPKIEASSIGTVVAGLREFRKLMLAKSEISYQWRYKDNTITVELLAQLIAHGESALEKILPWECIRPADKKRRFDASLLFLIFPLDVINEEAALQIVADVKEHLQGGIGIRRYLADSFWCQDFQKLPRAIQTSPHPDRTAWLGKHNVYPSPGNEAQWCIFDPILSCIYGMRYKSSKRDPADLKWQTYYLNRSLSQITANTSLIPMGESGEPRENIAIPAYRCPELYFLMAGHYIPNVSTPLLWTQANLLMALEVMIRSLKLPCP
ncbi:glycoside hydrolase family 15 protein [Synechococcus sp. BA-132 BA5]|uniref:glycoside hydrolase family 15 protein n=1 Tax=Synechococcus sp. BA-132 BA5 TaxID=3110252 RepID=UPI002B20C485|nr:glycoside hydrolase family 15 protein [Synechococcus sp. BA-132 BA5]MEA5414506.1 glycoside hydrolase family 15 protein [Synechococcus sp. BA-132 BA5]